MKNPNSVANRRKAEIEAGQKRLAQKGVVPAANPVSAVVDTTIPVVDPAAAALTQAPVIEIPGVTDTPGIADFASGQTLVTGEALTPEQIGAIHAAQIRAQEQDLAQREAQARAAEAAEIAGSPVADLKIYTEEELREIATHGIKGLRAIADPLGVKGIAKEELIREILAAQAAAPKAPVEAPVEEPAAPVISDADLDDLLND